MTHYKIAVIPGDGIGPEVTDEALRVLEFACHAGGIDLSIERLSASCAHWLKTGTALPESDLQTCRDADAVFLGAVGLEEARHPDGREVSGDIMFGLRFGLDLYAGVRPIRSFRGVPGPLVGAPKIDYVIVRENTEGMFASRAAGTNVRDETIVDSIVMTRKGVERAAEMAFAIAISRAEARPGDKGSTVTCVDKSNVLSSYAFFRRIYEDVGRGYSDVHKDHAYVDAMTLYQVQRPGTFDVVLAENLVGDIISDLGAATIGGLGMAPSGDIGKEAGMFQPSHGSAPDITGRGVANPAAAILSAAMMLHWLGEQHLDEAANLASIRIDQAVDSAIASGEAKTRDIAGQAGTVEAADAVLRELKKLYG